MKKAVVVLSILCVVLVITYVVTFFVTDNEANIIDNIAYTVIIDAGHGGIDGGVVGRATGVKESDLNLAVAKETAALFSENGFNVVMTRKDAGGLYGLAVSGRKKRDMQKRKDIIKSANPDLVISIHMNSSSATYRKGAQVFYQSGDTESGELSRLMQELLNDRELGYGSPQKGDYYILQCSNAPGIIVECGFLTNAEDEARLQSKDYQKRMAEGIFTGAVTYLFR